MPCGFLRRRAVAPRYVPVAVAEPLPMPIHLALRDAAGSPMADRLVFVIDPDQVGSPLVDALRGIAGVAVPSEPLELFGRGLHTVFGNHLTARPVGGGLAALCDDQSFLRAVRALADAVYRAVPGAVVVDASPGNADAPHVIAGVFPDALFFVVESSGDGARAAALIEARRIVPIERAVLADRSRLDALVATHLAVPSAPLAAPPPAVVLAHSPVFVVGCPRSGTTWVQNLLAAHPKLVGPTKETAVFVAVHDLLENNMLERALGRDGLVGAVRSFIATLANAYLNGADARLLEKTPLHALHLERIAEVFPDAWVVGVHRDGRDVVRSLLEVDSGTNDAAIAAASWVEITQAVADFAAHAPRVRDEQYEAWLRDPIIGAIDVLAWLGLPPDESVIDELRRRAPERVSQYNTTGDVGEGKWRTLPVRDLRSIVKIAGDQLIGLGYADTSVTAPESLLARFRRSTRQR